MAQLHVYSAGYTTRALELVRVVGKGSGKSRRCVLVRVGDRVDGTIPKFGGGTSIFAVVVCAISSETAV